MTGTGSSYPSNREVARVLLHIADLLEIAIGDTRRASAYRRAARSIDKWGKPVAQLAQEGRLETIPGIGPTIAAVVTDIIQTGTCPLLEKLRGEVPASLLELLRIPGIGPRTIHTLYTGLGITTVDELREAAEQGKIRHLPGFGVKSEQKLLKELAEFRRRVARGLYAEVEPVALQVVNYLVRLNGVLQVSYAGSLRRRLATVGNIDIVAAVNDDERAVEVLAAFQRWPDVKQILEETDNAIRVLLDSGLECRLQVVSKQVYPVALQYYTGSPRHNQQLRQLARERGFRLCERRGLFRDSGAGLPEEPVSVRDEQQLYEKIGLPYIYPELREGSGELEAALAGELPVLVQCRDLKGDLHVHTSWSDGRLSIEAMHAAAREKGYEYLAITDHSVSLAVAGGLDASRLVRQAHRVRELRELSGPPYLLAGTEVDIRADGSLDYEDGILADLDIVVASVHSHFQLGKENMTRRIIRALENPHVDILGHPTGRLLGYRDGYQVDMDAVLAAAARTGTVIEINSSPERLDLPDHLVRKAVDMGVYLAVNSDAHDAEGLDFTRFGIYMARRGWSTADNIVNTWTLDRLLAFLQLPKGKRVGF